jgi:hypothetical protein
MDDPNLIKMSDLSEKGGGEQLNIKFQLSWATGERVIVA